MQPSPQTFVGIYSDNCPEWVITEHAAYSYSMVVVSLNDTLGPDACAFIINQGKIWLNIICKSINWEKSTDIWPVGHNKTDNHSI